MMREQLILAGIFFLAALLTVPLLLKREMLRPPQQGRISQASLPLLVWLTLLAFAIYFFAAFLIQPFAIVVDYWIPPPHSNRSDLRIEAFAQALYVLLAIVLLYLFVRAQSQGVRAEIWGMRMHSPIRLLLTGALLCLLSYPLVMFLTQLVQLVVGGLVHAPPEPQMALSQLKGMLADPPLFWSYAFLVVTCIPLLEELLFRGFLLAMTVRLFGPLWGVCATSLVFALFHYSSGQRWSNYSILIGLFCFAYILGIARLRYQSLWVTIGMHSLFNILGLSVLVLTS